MKFLIIIICLALNYWTVFGTRFRQMDFLSVALRWALDLLEKIGLKKPSINLAILLTVTFLLVLFVYAGLSVVSFGVLGFVFALAVLLYCLNGFAFKDQIDAESVLSAALEDLFSVIFWFFLLGPMGAALYRVNAILANLPEQAELSGQAARVQAVLDWMPARLLAFCFSVVGHFTAVIGPWLDQVISPLQMNRTIVLDCAEKAFAKEGEATDLSAKREYMISLVYRSLVVWLVFLAVTVLYS